MLKRYAENRLLMEENGKTKSESEEAQAGSIIMEQPRTTRRITSRSQWLKPAILYLDDIQFIYDLLGEHCKEVTIRTGEFDLTSVDSIRELADDYQTTLEVSGREPYINAQLGPDSCHIFVLEDSVTNCGLQEKIAERIRKRKNPLRCLTHESLAPPIVQIAILVALISANLEAIAFIPLFAISTVLNFVWIGRSIYNTRNRFVMTYPTDFKGRNTFLRRNGDKMVLALITTTLGTIVGILIKTFLMK